jgi:hypothetical protein
MAFSASFALTSLGSHDNNRTKIRWGREPSLTGLCGLQRHARNVTAGAFIGPSGWDWLVNEIICDPQETVGLTGVLRFGEPRE